MVYLEAQGDGAVLSSLTNGPHPLYVPIFMLFLDCVLYLLLAMYLDQVLPGELGTLSQQSGSVLHIFIMWSGV